MSDCSDCHGCASGAVAELPRPAAVRTVALVGPPNSGKTTLFNRLTGLRQKVANFPGVTVEQHTGIAELPDGRAVSIVDLPGIYSLHAALGRRAGGLRRAARQARRHTEAGSRAAGAGFHQPGAPPDAGGADSLARPAHADHPEYGGRPAQSRRQAGSAQALARTRRAGGADQRARRRGHRRGLRFSGGRHGQARCPRCCRCCRTCRSAASGPARSAPRPATARRSRPSGRAAWTRSFCIRWPARWSSCWWWWA